VLYVVASGRTCSLSGAVLSCDLKVVEGERKARRRGEVKERFCSTFYFIFLTFSSNCSPALLLPPPPPSSLVPSSYPRVSRPLARSYHAIDPRPALERTTSLPNDLPSFSSIYASHSPLHDGQNSLEAPKVIQSSLNRRRSKSAHCSAQDRGTAFGERCESCKGGE
jgi:hypothetical protein